MTMLPSLDESKFSELFLEQTPLLDVRAPLEFKVGAIPNATNLPLMNDEERHEVGKRYKANGQDAAIELGHKLVCGDKKAMRIEAWQAFVSEHPGGALYCFRGGVRSRTSQVWLHEAGSGYPLIEGGYKALRQYLIKILEHWVPLVPAIVVGGRTGTGKTRVLVASDRMIDLEGLANHRGSSFGATLTRQPSNIDFENALAVEYLKLGTESLERPIVLEDEARMIGRVSLPMILRKQLAAAPVAILDVEFDERVQNVLEDYVIDLVYDYEQRDGDEDGLNAFYYHHKNAIGRIQKRLGGDNTRRALLLLEAAFEKLVGARNTTGFYPYIAFLLQHYYDPMYDYQIAAKQDRIQFTGNGDAVIEWVAKKVGLDL